MAGYPNGWQEAEYRLMKNIDLDEPTSFLDHVCLGCTQCEREPNEIIIEEYRKMFESRISAGATEKLPGRDKTHPKTGAWSYDMEGHAQKCVERHCERENKKTEQLYKVSSPCLDDHHSRKRNLNQLENLQKYAHRLSFNACTWHELVDLTFFGQ